MLGSSLGPRPKTNPSADRFQYSRALYWKRYMCQMRSGDKTSLALDETEVPSETSVRSMISRNSYETQKNDHDYTKPNSVPLLSTRTQTNPPSSLVTLAGILSTLRFNTSAYIPTHPYHFPCPLIDYLH